jgi:hypothetical protein
LNLYRIYCISSGFYRFSVKGSYSCWFVPNKIICLLFAKVNHAHLK